MQNYSVVIPVFNGADTIVECLNSVFGQSVKPEEIIVVDDGSTDNTCSIVEMYADKCELSIKLIKQKNLGPGAATTAGFKVVKTHYLAGLDADDIWVKDKIKMQMSFMKGNQNLHGVFGHSQSFVSLSDLDLPKPSWTRSALFMTLETANAIGPINDGTKFGGEMVGWLGRAREMGFNFELIDEVVFYRRIRPGSLTYGNPEDLGRGYLNVAREAILRRKKLARDKGNI